MAVEGSVCGTLASQWYCRATVSFAALLLLVHFNHSIIERLIITRSFLHAELQLVVAPGIRQTLQRGVNVLKIRKV
jgi:hypothetical protein